VCYCHHHVWGGISININISISKHVMSDPRHRSPADINARLDRLIQDIREKWHAPVMGEGSQEGGDGDVLIVAHGHILRAFAQRWADQSLHGGPSFLLEAGGVGTLR
jgi:probable phosphoglycerate mutase